MLKAIIFDFDGVISNSEPVHFSAFQRVLAEEGIHISLADYYQRYLAYDDRGAFTAAFRDAGRKLPDLHNLIERKAHFFRNSNEVTTYPDAIRFIRTRATAYPRAINSGARREEIEHTLNGAGLIDYFPVIVSTEDIERCKPDPQGYLLALERINTHHNLNLKPEECMAIEDSTGGIRSAIAAGMKCIAVANTYSVEQLRSTEATAVVASLDELTEPFLQSLFGGLS